MNDRYYRHDKLTDNKKNRMSFNNKFLQKLMMLYFLFIPIIMSGIMAYGYIVTEYDFLSFILFAFMIVYFLVANTGFFKKIKGYSLLKKNIKQDKMGLLIYFGITTMVTYR